MFGRNSTTAAVDVHQDLQLSWVEHVAGLETNEDPDIADDAKTMRQLVTIVEQSDPADNSGSIGAPPDPWPQD